MADGPGAYADPVDLDRVYPRHRTDVPTWLTGLARQAADDSPPELVRYLLDDPARGRPSAVLVLFGTGDAGTDLLLVRRSRTLRSHPDEVCFPGGSVSAGDRDVVHTALRESAEETGLDPAGVAVAGTLRPLRIAWTDFRVTPVLGWWGAEAEPRGDRGEVVSVHRVPLAEFADPANRFRVRYQDGYISPGFLVRELFVWGFTGSIVDWLMRLAGWGRPWDTSRIEELPDALRRYGGGFGR
nr:hypothetical protein [Streptantibioticus cattleyicolor]